MDPNVAQTINQQEEARKHLRAARDYMNVWFCCKPDYLGASPHFKEAAERFVALEDYDTAVKCYDGLAECDEKMKDLFGASEAHKELGFIYLQYRNDTTKAIAQFTEAINLLKLNADMPKVQLLQMRIARKCADLNNDELMDKYYREVMADLFTVERYLGGAPAIQEYLEILIEKSKFVEAIDLYKTHIQYLMKVQKYDNIVSRSCLGIIAIYIVMGESYMAEEKFKQFDQDYMFFRDSGYYRVASNMLDAIAAQDQARYNKALQHAIMSQIESSLHKKLRKVQVVGGPAEPKPGANKPKKKAEAAQGNGEAKRDTGEEEAKLPKGKESVPMPVSAPAPEKDTIDGEEPMREKEEKKQVSAEKANVENKNESAKPKQRPRPKVKKETKEEKEAKEAKETKEVPAPAAQVMDAVKLEDIKISQKPPEAPEHHEHMDTIVKKGGVTKGIIRDTGAAVVPESKPQPEPSLVVEAKSESKPEVKQEPVEVKKEAEDFGGMFT